MTRKPENGSKSAPTQPQGHAGEEDEFGYGKPPKHTRFKPGQSGNPEGRPRGAKGFEAMLKRELDRKIAVTVNGRSTKISRAAAMMKRVVEQGLKGDFKAIRFIAEYDSRIAVKLEAQIDAAANKLRESAPDRGETEILSHFAQLARDGKWSPNEEETE